MRNRSYEKWKRQMLLSAKEKIVPIVGHFELTPRCNLDCKMCYIHNQDSNALKDKELSTEKWKQIFDEAVNCGMMFANLSGGECLLRQDFKELYLHLWKKRIFITVMSNGLLVNRDYIEFFKKYPPVCFQISLYGSNDDGYLRVTGHRGFDKVMAAIDALTEINIPVYVTATPSRYMGEDLINIQRICKEKDYWHSASTFDLVSKRDESDNSDYDFTIDEKVELSIKQELLSRQVIPLDYDPPLCGGTCNQAPKGTTCTAGKAMAVVSWDGTMHPCALMPIGKASVLNMSYAEAWEKTKEAVQEVLLGMECVGCPYDKLCPKCPSMRLTGLYTGHCNPDVCEVTRRLVAAGVKKLPKEEQA